MNKAARATLAVASVALGLALYTLPPSPLRGSAFGRELALAAPRALAALALIPAALWLAARSLAHLSPARRRLASALRGLLLASLALALSQPSVDTRTRRSSTVFVVDVSDSISDAALERARSYVTRARRAAGREHVELVTFARSAARSSGANAPIVRHAEGGGTNLERALTLASALHRAPSFRQVVLFSDLRDTEGSAERALVRAATQAALYYAPSELDRRPEVGIVDLVLPREVRVGESFELRARVYASMPCRASLRIVRDGAPNTPESERALTLERGESVLRIPSVARHAGALRYELAITPSAPDTFPENNRFERSTIVRGAPRVLYVERTRAESEAFARLLESAAFEVDARPGKDAPRSAEELAPYAFYVLSDVAAATLGTAAMQAIRSYVEGGGGFMMAGGEQSFGPGGYQGSPLEPILPVSLSGSLERREPTLALMLVLDKSGSMAGEKLERAKEATLATAELLGSENYLGVIGFDAEAVRVVRLSVASQTASIAHRVSTLAAGGGTALFPALDAAYRDLVSVAARVKHVVVLTDGQSQEEALDDLVESMRLDGVTVSMVGLGDDVNRGLLEALAKTGGGRAYFTRDPARVPRLFTDEAQVVARSPLRERAVRAAVVRPAAFTRAVDVALAPPLAGFVHTRARPSPAELLLVARHEVPTQGSGREGEPLLARMRVGRGWSLAFTSDVKGRWSAEWYRFRELPRLFSALLREHMREDASDARAIDATLEGDTLRATIDVLDEGPAFVNGLTGTLRVLGPRASHSVPLRQTAAGRYEARTPVVELGSYTLEATLEGGHGRVLARGQIARPFPSEYTPAGSEPALAARVRDLARPLPPPDRLFATPPISTPRELWPMLVGCALLVYLLDLTVRRLPPWRMRSGRPLDGEL